MNKNTKQFILLSSIFTLVYCFVNYLAIFIPFIPGIEVLIFWSLVFPIGLIFIHWMILKRKKEEIKNWVTLGIISTAFYLFTGFTTFYIVTAIWASI